MRRTEIMILYELTPEERENNALDEVIKSDIKAMNENYHPWSKWECVKQTPKHRMLFDAGYNSYYAKVHYERTS